jgi:hypothetical protein
LFAIAETGNPLTKTDSSAENKYFTISVTSSQREIQLY